MSTFKSNKRFNKKNAMTLERFEAKASEESTKEPHEVASEKPPCVSLTDIMEEQRSVSAEAVSNPQSRNKNKKKFGKWKRLELDLRSEDSKKRAEEKQQYEATWRRYEEYDERCKSEAAPNFSDKGPHENIMPAPWYGTKSMSLGDLAFHNVVMPGMMVGFTLTNLPEKYERRYYNWKESVIGGEVNINTDILTHNNAMFVISYGGKRFCVDLRPNIMNPLCSTRPVYISECSDGGEISFDTSKGAAFVPYNEVEKYLMDRLH